IGEKLGVSTLLEGTVRKQGDRVRIVAELINAADGIEVWNRTFDHELKDIFAVQQEIARAVAESLKVTLLGSEEKSTQMATNSVEAHNAYLQAHFHRQRGNVEDYRKAITYFDRAIELDPNYALAYAEPAEVWTRSEGSGGRRAGSIVYLLRRNSTSVGSFSTRENLMRQMRPGAKWQSCSRPRLPVIAGRCSSPSNVATARQRYAKHNWNLTTA